MPISQRIVGAPASREAPDRARKSAVARSSSLIVTLLFAAVAFHVAFPKGGFTWHQIPITWADATFGLVLGALVYRLKGSARSVTLLKLMMGLVLFGAAFFAFRILAQEGFVLRFVNSSDIGEIVPLCVYPLILIAMLQVVDTELRQKRLVKFICLGVAIVLLYGIAQKALGVDRTIIPGLTANSAAFNNPFFISERFNTIGPGGELKLTSTYQNGNLLGVNLLLLLPLAIGVAKRKWFKVFLIGAGLFALAYCGSRAAWVGALTLGLVWACFGVKRLAAKIGLFVAIGSAVAIFLFYVPIARTRVMSQIGTGSLTSMGGRVEPASILLSESLKNANVRAFLVGPDQQQIQDIGEQGGGAYEILYLAIFQIAGVLGILIWLAPLVLALAAIYKYRSDPIERAIFISLVAYLVCAIAEGAFWLPPTSFNLYMIVGLGLLRYQSLKRAVPAAKQAAVIPSLRDAFMRPVPVHVRNQHAG
ncbi:MAG: O-antigen ligase family protein [Terriglobia bacterium]